MVNKIWYMLWIIHATIAITTAKKLFSILNFKVTNAMQLCSCLSLKSAGAIFAAW